MIKLLLALQNDTSKFVVDHGIAKELIFYLFPCNSNEPRVIMQYPIP